MTERRLVGRDAELRQLMAAFEGALAGTGHLVRVVGEPGIGKTRLASELARMAADRGAAVAWGRCWESGGAPAFWPWTQILRAMGEATPEAAHRAASSASEAEHERFLLFDAMSRLIGEKSREAPRVIVFDDAHASDVPSLLFLKFLAQGLAAMPVLLVVTHREVEARVRPEIGDLLAKVARHGTTVFPRRLEAADIATWLANIGRSEREAAAVHRATEGNPLFVEHLLELPKERGLDLSGADAVQAAISEYVARLSAGARLALEVAAVLGREASRQDLAAMSEDRAELDAHLREGIALGIVEARGEGTIAFRHVLLRDALYATIEGNRKNQLHARAAEIYARRAELGDDDAFAPAAHHTILCGNVETAVERTRRAAARAMGRVAYEEAAQLLERAVGLLDAHGGIDKASACGLLVDWGEALLLSGSSARGRDVCARAASLAKTLGESSLLARAALAYGAEIQTASRDERMIVLLRDALASLGDQESALRARLMARLASALIPAVGGSEEHVGIGAAAIEMVRRCGGSPEDTLFVLQYAAGGIAFAGRTVSDRQTLTDEMVTLARSLDQRPLLVMGLTWAVVSDFERSDGSALNQHLAELSQLAPQMPPTLRIRAPLSCAMRSLLSGDAKKADTELAEAAQIADEAPGPTLHFVLAVARLCQLFWLRDLAEFHRVRETLGDAFERMPAAGPFAVALMHAIGVDVGALPRDSARPTLHRSHRSLMAVGLRAWAAVLLEDPALAADVIADVESHHALGDPWIVVGGGAGHYGPTSLVLGELSILVGRNADAERLLARTAADSDSMGMTLVAERARRALSKIGKSAPRASSPPPAGLELTRQGEMWTLRAGQELLNLKPSKGFSYLAMLLENPNQEIHVAQIVGAADTVTGDAGVMLDEAAKQSYRIRATELRAMLDEATANSDEGRMELARAELDALSEELARAVGLGGRDRKAASDVERMRINVQRRLRDAIERVRAQSTELGRYLDASVRTGAFCSYNPVSQRF